MRKILTILAMMALAGCGGGGAGTTTTPPQSPATTAPQSGMVTPQFTIVIPARGSSASSRSPQYVSSATLSVKITLTADSVGIVPGTITGNPATTNISPTCGAGGCTATVNGPPSPPGTDSFTIFTYDAASAGGNELNAAQLNNVTITAGQANSQNVILGAIPATLTVSGVPAALNAGTQTQTATVSVVAKDAHGDTIPTGRTPNVFYVNAAGAPINVTLSDPDTAQHGSCVINTGTSTCTTGAGTSVTFPGPDTTKVFAYDGVAELPVTLTASASGATNGTAPFQPNLNAPVFNGSQATPSGVALSGSAEIDLFATSGVGSTGSESFTELGWTGSPYNHALTFANTGACTSGAGITAASMADIATISVGTNSTTQGTPITATINTTAGAPKPGSCPSTISDGLSGNTTDGSATLTVTYTNLSITGQSKRRQ
jgi:hypothetical protein